MAGFFSSVQRDRSTFCALMHFYQLLPYVLSTSFSTHPKPLTWNKKPFQSRRVNFFRHYETFPLFRHCETVQISHFFPNFFYCSPHQFLIFCNRMEVQKIPKGPPFHIFWHYATYWTLQKKFRKKIGIFFSIFNFFWELLLSPVVEKVVFESFWALDMAPTWSVPGLFLL